jgi:peptidoglycan/xylan/chitin deacetylase (PgdA/CDA1 family)/glycosyltransferase involved in cell wall biosynthesis
MSAEIAVVITSYGLGKFLEDAVNSLAAQTLPPAEVLLVDDGSEDASTRQALAAIEADHPGVRVIRTPHRGPGSARNTGIEATTAPLVVLLDGDDMFAPTYLAQAGTILDDRDDLGFVSCALEAFGGASYRWKPPPYTIAEALGRGACGHISAVFRREVWELTGGFDESLAAYEDVDFWLRALKHGFRGLILDDALLRYRVRRDSRYHATIARNGYLRAKTALLDKHLEDAPRPEDVFTTMLAFERELRGHDRTLMAEADELEQTIAAAEADRSRALTALSDREIAALDWGDLASWPEAPAPGPNPVESELMDRALADLVPGPAPRRTLVVRPGDPWPSGSGRGHDLIVLRGALEHTETPADALRQARHALRRGGTLVVVAATTATGAGRRLGITGPSLNQLLCDAFAPEHVAVRSYGNLKTTVASVAGLPADALPAAELGADDPTHATVVAGVAGTGDGAGLTDLRRRAQPPARRTAVRLQPRRGAILAYHRIASLMPDVHRLCTPPETFAVHMEMIARDFRPVALSELATSALTGELEPGAIAVTFDDGYLDNLEMASPVLVELGIPATFFVNGDPGTEEREPWWATVERVLLGGERIPQRLELETAGVAVDLATGGPEARKTALLAVHGRLLHAGRDQVREFVAALVDWSGLELSPRPSHRLMTSDEVVSLADRDGHTVGAHTLDHLSLPGLPADERMRQLADCRSELAALLGSSVISLAYPYGACDFATAAAAQAAGFSVAVTTEPDPVMPGADPLRLPRLELADDSPDALTGRLDTMLRASP